MYLYVDCFVWWNVGCYDCDVFGVFCVYCMCDYCLCLCSFVYWFGVGESGVIGFFYCGVVYDVVDIYCECELKYGEG